MVASARRPLLPYAALVLEHIVRKAEPRDVVFSALGVREGLLYSLLDAEERKKDALIAAAPELNQLRSRSPQHGEELIAWTDAFMATLRHRRDAPRKSGCATPPACSPTSAGARIPITAASSRST